MIAWQVEDRATRGGGQFGMWLEHEAKRHGLRVYYPGEDLSGVPYGSVVRVSKYEAAKEFSVNNGRRTAQGQDWAKKQGFFRTAGLTPTGCDRLYLSAENKPKYIIHNVGNGLQEQVDYETKEVIGSYGTIGKKSRNRFKKQRNEYSLLTPGDREERRVVRVIFYLRHKRGWRGCRIADYLNRLKVPAPRGGEWSPRQVESIYENEAYTGVTYNDQTYSGRFFRRDSRQGFVALERDELELVLRKTFTPKLRPMDEWERIDQPYMYHFLPRDLRDLAINAQATMWQNRTDPTRKKRKSNAHPASQYLFSGKLIAKQDNGILRGTLCGPADAKTPYYRHQKAKRGRRKGSIYNNLIRADVLHEAAVQVLAEVLNDAENLREHLTAIVVEQRRAAVQDAPDVAQLEAEREELKLQISATMKSLKGAALAEAQQELTRLGERRNAIEERLKHIHTIKQTDLRPVEAVVSDAMTVIAEESHRLLSLSVEPLREAINRLIPNLQVDMETKVVEFSVLLPTAAIQQRPKPKRKRRARRSDRDNALCPPPSLWSQVSGWTQAVFGTIRCEYDWSRGSHLQRPCYRCRRTKAA